MLALHIIALVAAVKLLVETENVVLCASLYTGLCMVVGLFFGTSLLGVLLGGAMTFAYSFAYFWLLNRWYSESILVFWMVFLVGLSAPALVRFLLSSLIAG